MLRKLLIVDDDALNLTLITEMLGRQTFQYLRACNGEECLATACRERPSMIIMDWQMPKMDGMEALRHLKADPVTSGIPVLIVTGVMTAPVDLMTAMEEGAVDYLQKPFDRLELRARVRNMLMLADAVTEVQEKYLQIESSSKLIETLFAGIPHPLVYYSTQGEIIRCNDPFRKIAEQAGVESPDGRLIYSFYPEEERALHFQRDYELVGNGHGISYEATCRLTSSEYLFSKELHKQPDGTIAGIICAMTDITPLKRSHTEMMESKKRELVSSALRLIHISEMNSNLISELGKLHQHVDEEGRRLIKDLVKQNSLTTAEGVWQDFESRFENVYESFYNSLNAQFPDLTPGERKLCALLRLNISSKDIAAITLQNPQSIDMARYRLRKKLNLSPEDNLVDFLLKIDQ
jgi:CheY-like chemotaxis protein/DNA-binding CsgD family transcriptional regulator